MNSCRSWHRRVQKPMAFVGDFITHMEDGPYLRGCLFRRGIGDYCVKDIDVQMFKDLS